MSRDYEFQDGDGEFASAVAAATFVIQSLEEAEAYHRRNVREDFNKAKTKDKSTEEAPKDGSAVTKHFSSREVKVAGETSARKPSRSISVRPINSSGNKLNQTSTSSYVVDSKADSWENVQLAKINRRYEKMKSRILEWESVKKIQAKSHMEKKKNQLELIKARNLQHYQNKVARIDLIAGGARGQLEEKRRNKESEVREKANFMRSKGIRSHMKCFCC